MDESRYPLFNKVRHDPDVKVYISEQNIAMKALGFTEHSQAHVKVVADRTAEILEELGDSDHTIDLALTAAWPHDIGNIVNRKDHSQSGAMMAFEILRGMQVPAEDVAKIICAIGNHDEGTGVPVSRISAALILADKSDVRRSRVQNEDFASFDIHDRVNYSVTQSLTQDQQEPYGDQAEAGDRHQVRGNRGIPGNLHGADASLQKSQRLSADGVSSDY